MSLLSLDGVGVDDFQLYLLKTMDPPAASLTRSLARLDRTEHDLLERYEVVSPLLRMLPGSARDLASILADALVAGPGEAGDRTYRYRLPLWPEFAFSVSSDASGQFIDKAEFTNDPAHRAVSRTAVVWRFLETDLSGAFTRIRQIDGWGHYRSYLAEDPGSGRAYFLRFAWALLQEVGPAPRMPEDRPGFDPADR